MVETQSLHFYTEGEGFTNLLRNFLEEGKNFTVYQILRDGGFTESLANQFIRGELQFTGTTQYGEDLGVQSDTYDGMELLKQSLRSILYKYDDDDSLNMKSRLVKYMNDADIRILKNAFGEDVLLNLFRTDEINEYTIELINNEGYGYISSDSAHGITPSDIDDGLILPNGDIITCGYQEHSSLYPFLRELGLVKHSCWTDCEETIHISSGQISGTVSHMIGSRYKDITPAEPLLKTLFTIRRHLKCYGHDYEISTKLLHDCGITENYGGKWNNLSYLKKYYTDINLPKFSKEEIPGVKNCLRTSPKFSLPGLLDSVFDITETSIGEMQATFEKYKDIHKGNELHVFYQEYIEGSNGVLHYDEEGFRYDISANRGDIVQGKKGDEFISETALGKLKNIGESLFLDFDEPVQLEFVINGDDVWIVQLRKLENNAERTVILNKPENCLAVGKTFSKGSIDVDVKDILILKSDGDSELLLGKKALIVTEDVEFSHILALSKSLKIPSIYATGKIELPSEGEVKFIAYNTEAWITKK